MNPLLAEVVAERFPTAAQVAWEKQHSADLVLGELALVKYERRRTLERAMTPNRYPHIHSQTGRRFGHPIEPTLAA